VAIFGKFEEEFSFVASMGNVPDVTRNKMSLCSCHNLQGEKPFLALKKLNISLP
jgi:hypothetical protein